MSKICPLLFASAADIEDFECRPDRCAWWDRLAGTCCLVSGADNIREAANQLNALNIILEKKQEGDQ